VSINEPPVTQLLWGRLRKFKDAVILFSRGNLAANIEL